MPETSIRRRRRSWGPAILSLALLSLGGYYVASSGGAPTTIQSPVKMTAAAMATLTPPPLPSSAPAAAAPAPALNWWEVSFTDPLRLSTSTELQFIAHIPAVPYQGSIAERLIQSIDAAQSTIHIASFETDLDDVTNALIRARQRGVDVRWITDDESGIQADTKPGRGQFKKLKTAGVPVIDDGRGALMHDKFWLFDGQTVWSGSTNITVSGMFEQNNNTIIIQSPELAAIYERQFADMWSGKFNAKSPSTVDQQAISIGGTRIQILFSPEDKAISHILPFVQSARTGVEFLAFTFTQDQLGKAMVDRKQAGVDVRGIFETTGSTSEYSEMTALYCVHAAVRQDGNPAFMHDKVIIIDNHIVITGSLNFTDNADQQNNENVLIIDNAAIAKLYSQEFQRVWDAGHDPDPANMKCK